MLGIGLSLLRGIKLPSTRILLLLGLLHMAFAHGRADLRSEGEATRH
jgi:hypothetical protein